MTGTVLLVGATSPIGTAVAAELRQRGWSVTGTSTRPIDGMRVLDIDDGDQVRAALEAERPDAVISLASPVLSADAHPDIDARAAQSLERLHRLSGQAGVRSFVFASSAAVYGTSHATPRAEGDDPEPASRYAALKLACESVLEAGARPGGSTTALRIFNVYGPGLRSSLVNRMFSDAGEPPAVYDTAHFVRDYVHVTDVARAFAAAVMEDKSGYALVNVGTGIGTSNAALLAAQGARGTPEPVEPGFLSVSVADLTAQLEVLGIGPSVAVADVINGSESTRRHLLWGSSSLTK